LFGHPHVVCTPHLGASTLEAQENVALQIAEQMSDYLTRGAIANAVNFPSITAEEAPKLTPFAALAEKLGLFAGQLARKDIAKICIEYEGAVASLKTKAITAAAIAGFLRPFMEEVNVVSAPVVAKERGVVVEEVTREANSDYESLVTLRAISEDEEICVAGTVFHDGKLRILRINGIGVDAEFAPSMIFLRNEDKPGFLGRFAGALGAAAVNIATIALGRDQPGGSAVALVAIDGETPPATLAAIQALPGVKRAETLKF
jgi:D-3-phosphoglycerate dehydrogenase / 2-oxoglutarate reductase